MLRTVFPIVLTVSLVATPYVGITQTVEQLFRQGVEAYNEGRYREAERIFRQFITIDPNDAGAYNNMGLALEKQGKLEEAIAAYEKAIELDPNYSIAYHNMGVALEKQGKYDEAIAAYKKALEINPNRTNSYLGIGNALRQQGKLEEAIAAYEKAIELDPNYAKAYYNMARTLYNQGRYDEAIIAIKKAIEIDPNYTNAYVGMGNVLSEQGKLEEAIAAYKKAIELDPNFALAYSGIGVVLEKQGKLEEAITAYKKAIKIDPNFAFAYFGMGYTLYIQGKLEEAIAAYKKAIELDPNYTDAYNNMGYALFKQGKLEEAIAAYKKAIEIDPNNVKAKNNLKEAERLLAINSNPLLPNIDDRDYLPTESQEPLVKKLRSTARIIATTSEGASIGTGWVIQRQGNTVLIVTNRHVISDNKSKRPSDTIEVEFYSTLDDRQRPRYKATIEQITDSREDLDLAVVKVTGIPDDIQPLSIKSGWIQRNLEITIIGHPFNITSPWSAVKGEVMNYSPNNKFIPLDALVADGNSGGPVLNPAGEVIAMMVSIRLRNDIVPVNNREAEIFLENARSTGDLGLAYPIDLVMKKLQEWGIVSGSQ